MNGPLLSVEVCGKLALALAQAAGNASWDESHVIADGLGMMTLTLLKGRAVKWAGKFDRYEVGRKTPDEFCHLLRSLWPAIFGETEAKRAAREAGEAESVNRVRKLAEAIGHDLDGIRTRLDEMKKLLGELE